jgi:four helix bundle protein
MFSVAQGHAELADQLRRSAQSTPQNIAEGAGRMTKPDKARHYTIARGSAMESASHLDVMKVEGVLDEAQYLQGIGLLEGVVSMLTRLIGPF